MVRVAPAKAPVNRLVPNKGALVPSLAVTIAGANCTFMAGACADIGMVAGTLFTVSVGIAGTAALGRLAGAGVALGAGVVEAGMPGIRGLVTVCAVAGRASATTATAIAARTRSRSMGIVILLCGHIPQFIPSSPALADQGGGVACRQRQPLAGAAQCAQPTIFYLRHGP